MAVINIGAPTISRPTYFLLNNRHTITLASPANATGVINSMSFFGYTGTLTNVKCGTFYGTPPTFTNRDYEFFGSIPSNSLQTFTGLNCDVETGDYLGITGTGGYIARTNGAGTIYFLDATDIWDGSPHTLSPYSAEISISGSGITLGKKWQGITISKWNGILVSKINAV